jgi:hypothetical protein
MKNLGTIDRIVRIVVGLALLSLLAILQGDLRGLGFLGLIPLATAVIGWCPAYQLFGFSSRPSHHVLPAIGGKGGAGHK